MIKGTGQVLIFLISIDFMKSVQISEYGSSDVIKIEENSPIPSPSYRWLEGTSCGFRTSRFSFWNVGNRDTIWNLVNMLWNESVHVINL